MVQGFSEAGSHVIREVAGDVGPYLEAEAHFFPHLPPYPGLKVISLILKREQE